MSNKRKGRAWLVKVSDGSGGFLNLVGLTGKGLSVNNSRIDVTSPDATNPEGELWRETLDDVKTVDASGDYNVVNSDAAKRITEIAMSAGAEDEFQIIIPGVGTFQGMFSVGVEFGGDGAVTGSLSMESNGKTTFTAEV
jgi:predicted secreted protein